jgi:hypothetical protein
MFKRFFCFDNSSKSSLFFSLQCKSSVLKFMLGTTTKSTPCKLHYILGINYWTLQWIQIEMKGWTCLNTQGIQIEMRSWTCLNTQWIQIEMRSWTCLNTQRIQIEMRSWTCLNTQRLIKMKSLRIMPSLMREREKEVCLVDEEHRFVDDIASTRAQFTSR